MLTEVMRHYGLTRPPIDAGFFETEHHAQVSRDIRAAIRGSGSSGAENAVQTDFAP